jgi:hypothetical protein
MKSKKEFKKREKKKVNGGLRLPSERKHWRENWRGSKSVYIRECYLSI